MRLLALVFVMSFVSVAQANDFMKLSEACAKTHPTSSLQVMSLAIQMQNKYSTEVSLIEGVRRKSSEGRSSEMQMLEFLAAKSAQLKAKGQSECESMLGALYILMKDTLVRAQKVAQLPSRQSFKMIMITDAEIKTRQAEIDAEDQKRTEEEQARYEANQNGETEQSAEVEAFSVDTCTEKNPKIEVMENILNNFGSAASGSMLSTRFYQEKNVVKDCAEYVQLLNISTKKAAAIDKEVLPIATAQFSRK